MIPTDQKIQDLQVQLDELKALRAKEREPEKWAPKKGSYLLRSSGISRITVKPDDEWVVNGSTCQTHEQAEQLSKARRTFQWMCQLAFELNPSGKLGGRFYVYYEKDQYRFKVHVWSDCTNSAYIFETHEAAIKAAEIMNRDPENWRFYQ